ncbi:hypothetical protein E6C76_03350 [Pseudothauera nasutitermitis]|uniref:Uncharacterized protein n=1 Tax=Pseudothauera nasutitermitis TaxID=2565930 RepID=A0A4V3WCJ3_9RHOO|nr:hypothetical protein [Pseudothauera nasutitermitis]THF67414.1 hypothetical protein E6C76_03350 [Pseudothauera nasutitermitis]
MNSTARVLLIALLLASTTAFAQVRTATIFLVPWEIETRSALGPSKVREYALVKTVIFEKHLAQSLLKWLTSESFNPPEVNPPLNFRLVIDFTLEDGSVESYYANRQTLLEKRSGKVRSIDEEFRSRFSFFLIPSNIPLQRDAPQAARP